MKKKFLGLEKNVKIDDDLQGYPRSWVTASSKGTSLTLENFEKMVEYVQSDEFHKREQERMEFKAMGEMIAAKAWDMKLITDAEYTHLLWIIGINGGLIISKSMYDKIKPAEKEVIKKVKAMRKKIDYSA